MSGLLIIGAGGHGKVVAETASLMGRWGQISFLDDHLQNEEVLGYPVIGGFGDIERYRQDYSEAFVAIGDNRTRHHWIQLLQSFGYVLPTLIHPHSVVSRSAEINDATIVMSGVVINASTSIGIGCILNTCSSIDHDCSIRDGVHVSPGVHVCGSVSIGEYSWIGAGSTIINNISVGRNAIVAAGSTVTHHVQSGVMVAGTPAVIKKHLGDEFL